MSPPLRGQNRDQDVTQQSFIALPQHEAISDYGLMVWLRKPVNSDKQSQQCHGYPEQYG